MLLHIFIWNKVEIKYSVVIIPSWRILYGNTSNISCKHYISILMAFTTFLNVCFWNVWFVEFDHLYVIERKIKIIIMIWFSAVWSNEKDCAWFHRSKMLSKFMSVCEHVKHIFESLLLSGATTWEKLCTPPYILWWKKYSGSMKLSIYLF